MFPSLGWPFVGSHHGKALAGHARTCGHRTLHQRRGILTRGGRRRRVHSRARRPLGHHVCDSPASSLRLRSLCAADLPQCVGLNGDQPDGWSTSRGLSGDGRHVLCLVKDFGSLAALVFDCRWAPWAVPPTSSCAPGRRSSRIASAVRHRDGVPSCWGTDRVPASEVLFINAEEMLQLSYQPTGHRPGTLNGGSIYEVTVTGTVAAVRVSSLTVSTLFLLGPEGWRTTSCRWL